MTATGEQVLQQFDRLVNKVLFLKRKGAFQYRDVRFYPSEVHLLLVVAEGASTNATAIASQIGVTKGAVSQTLNRLAKKGVLRKSRDPYNKNELNLHFTPFGREALQHYRDVAAQVEKRHRAYLCTFSEGEQQVIHRFLLAAEQVLDEIENVIE